MKSPRSTWASAVALAVLVASGATVAAATPTATATGERTNSSEEAQLQALYRQAVAEGGRLVVYAGGDKPGQADYLKAAFEKKFPKMKVDIVVDFSKNHDARVDNRIDEHHVVADVVHLQTTDDFPRWKKEGVLEKYKPVGWNKVYPQIKDQDGYYTGVFFFGFADVTATKLGSGAPVEAKDFFKPEFKDKLVLTYPNDDAVLYYRQITTGEA